MDDRGLYKKFNIQRTDRTDEPGGKHHGCRYFPLDLDHDPHAWVALNAYAWACRMTHCRLSNDIRHMVALYVDGGLAAALRFFDGIVSTVSDKESK